MALKIYFAASISGGRDPELTATYGKIVKILEKYGTVLSVHVASKDLTSKGESLPDDKIYKRDMAWLEEVDVLVAEVTQPSLGVGYEIANAEKMQKRILCLFYPRPDRRLSPMIRCIDNGSSVRVRDYNTEEEMNSILKEFFST